ncbi:LLM class F420-dependent oxidoreductase [Actinopolymorpha sp. B11F2]|uniref:LLM class F420-dependent oxidoreductase n=1 Tax=Actinopolymorpha sp. B11F2 TaxID=3160862 RepID=UPI0032E52EEE
MTSRIDTAAVKQRLGQVGTWIAALNGLPAGQVREAAAEIEELGYGSLWLADTPATKEPFSNAAILLAATNRLSLGTGIANVWGRDAAAMNSGAKTLGEAFPGRFLLGLGVSHQPPVAARGHTYERPLAKMRGYLDEMAAAAYAAAEPPEPVPCVLAALRPKMLELSRDRTDGAHPYFVPTTHTARAREILGEGPLLIPEQAVLVETDPGRAREVGREHTAFYLRLPNYVNSLRALGFTEEDVANGGSDRLVDAVVAWGSVDAVRDRVKEHLDAGADHVLLQPLAPDRGLDLGQLRDLAPALVG